MNRLDKLFFLVIASDPVIIPATIGRIMTARRYHSYSGNIRENMRTINFRANMLVETNNTLRLMDQAFIYSRSEKHSRSRIPGSGGDCSF